MKNKNTKIGTNGKPPTFEGWKHRLQYDYSNPTGYKKWNPSEIDYRKIMDTLRELRSEDDTIKKHFTKNMDEENKELVYSYIEKLIQSWELYRIQWIRKSHSERDVDGVPLPIVKHILRTVCHYSVDWEYSGMSNLKVEPIDDDEKCHTSMTDLYGVKTLGELFRRVEHQQIHYGSNYGTEEVF